MLCVCVRACTCKLSACACTICVCCVCFTCTHACMHIVAFVSFLATPLPLPRSLKLFLHLLVSVTMSWRMSSSTSCSKKWTVFRQVKLRPWRAKERRGCHSLVTLWCGRQPRDRRRSSSRPTSSSPPPSPPPPPPSPSPPPLSLVCSCARRSLTYTIFLLSLPCAYYRPTDLLFSSLVIATIIYHTLASSLLTPDCEAKGMQGPPQCPLHLQSQGSRSCP